MYSIVCTTYEIHAHHLNPYVINLRMPKPAQTHALVVFLHATPIRAHNTDHKCMDTQFNTHTHNTEQIAHAPKSWPRRSGDPTGRVSNSQPCTIKCPLCTGHIGSKLDTCAYWRTKCAQTKTNIPHTQTRQVSRPGRPEICLDAEGIYVLCAKPLVFFVVVWTCFGTLLNAKQEPRSR